MTISRERPAILKLTGIPLAHMDAFQTVATKQRCIVMCRAVGTACTQLIEESYSTKGFHVKAKSCNWGPMSGFVLDDPNLTKRKPDEVNKQGSDLKHAFKDWGAKATPLYISEPRRARLMEQGVITRAIGGNSKIQIVFGKQWPDQDKGFKSGKALRSMKFLLAKTDGTELSNAPTTSEGSGRYFDPKEADHAGNIKDTGAVYAMVNPTGLGGKAGGVRNAMTGDYDLFSLCVERGIYDPGGSDRQGKDARMVGVNQLSENLRQHAPSGEDQDLGNMSRRHHEVRAALNAAFVTAGYTGGNMVHHSDEAGRPFIDDVDMPVFAVVPCETAPYGIEDVADLRAFWNEWNRSYVPFFNPGWMSWLVGGRQGAKMLGQIRQGLTPSRAKVL